MSTSHPTFPNPTIQEALCEIYFCLPKGIEWKPSLLGDFFKHVQVDFPTMEPVTHIGVELQVGPGRASQALLPPRHRMRYKHASRNLMLQLSQDILTVNILHKYPGWEQMCRDVLDAWQQVKAVIKPAEITRIGLRYINLIKRSQPDELPGDWLAPSGYIPKSVLSSLPGFLSRLETRTDPHNRLVVTLGEASASLEQSPGAIVFDIDCISEKSMGIDDNSITAEITRLHDIAWTIFTSSRTSRLDRLLQGGAG